MSEGEERVSTYVDLLEVTVSPSVGIVRRYRVGTKPSKVAARLSLADWLLVVLLGTGTSVSSSTDAITAATVALVRSFIIGDMVARLVL